MASVVTKFARKCQIIENSVFHLGGKKTSREKSQKIVKILYFDIAAKGKKNVFSPITIEFVILEM